MFQTVSPSIIKSLALYTQQWYMSYRFCWLLVSGIRMDLIHPDPTSSNQHNLYDIHHCCVYSARLL